MMDEHRYCGECLIHSRSCPCLESGARCYNKEHLTETNGERAMQLLRAAETAIWHSRQVGYVPDMTYLKVARRRG